MTKPNGYILFEGPSMLDGAPIVVIATLKSRNTKTGDMIQTWILRSDINPLEAMKQAKDASICGACPHRPITLPNGKVKRTCYVNVGQAPMAVYKAYKRGAYPVATQADIEKHIKGRAVRFGAYGDPAAAPTWIWAMLANVASVHTGYTHQVNHKSFDPKMAGLVMVSADSPKQAAKYHAKGYRTFRVKNEIDGFLPGEIECKADSENINCIDCGLCDGISKAPSIAITVHGSGAASFKSSNIIAIAA